MKFPGSSILGHNVHPAARKFPLPEGEAFERIKNQIRETKFNVTPIVRSNGVILGGLGEAEAIEQLQNENLQIEPRYEEWKPKEGETEAIFAVSASIPQRPWNEEQRVVLVRDAYPEIQKEAQQRQQTTQIKPNEKKNPSGRRGKKELVATPELPPSPAEKLMKSREKTARSTDGQIAKLADVAVSTVRRVNKAIEHGGDEAREKILAGSAAKEFVPPKPKKQRPGLDTPAALREALFNELAKIPRAYAAAGPKALRKELASIIRDEREKFGELPKKKSRKTQPATPFVKRATASHVADKRFAVSVPEGGFPAAGPLETHQGSAEYSA